MTAGDFDARIEAMKPLPGCQAAGFVRDGAPPIAHLRHRAGSRFLS
jgi:hypothetical protein